MTNQIYFDWSFPPFVEIIIASDGLECPVGSEPVFYRKWSGLEPGCNYEVDGIIGESD